MNTTKETEQLKTAVSLLRITLGIIILVTWFNNLQDNLYTADGLTGFFNWLFDENGNASSLTIYKGFLDTAVVPVAGIFAIFQLVGEFLLGLALLLGAFTRLFSLFGMFFFANLFLSYFGGHEWIWTYVILFMSTLTVYLGYAGRKWGIDQWLLNTRGKSFLW
ncbi:MAG: DoxX family membrane protein [Chloroflexi bacterium]|nr:DoxX family membrane protein [Chloroflexota bacterium]